jgi:hypothetical protein
MANKRSSADQGNHVERHEISEARIEELLRFLRPFEERGRAFVEGWRGGEKEPDGTITMPYPAYLPDVLEFFRLAGQDWWSDHTYDPVGTAAMLEDDAAIQRATVAEVRAMLTYSVRGERFCDGHWEAVLRSGRIVAVLKRLEALRDVMRRSTSGEGGGGTNA